MVQPAQDRRNSEPLLEEVADPDLDIRHQKVCRPAFHCSLRQDHTDPEGACYSWAGRVPWAEEAVNMLLRQVQRVRETQHLSPVN